MRLHKKFPTPRIILSFSGGVGWGGVGGWWEKLILKLTSPSTRVGVEARAELGNWEISI